jgi:endonuclease/exonuclease/phosphatase family metal-dependent hydrolase
VGQPLLAGGSIPLETVRVLTLNLWGQSGDWSARRQILVAGLRALQPDLVGTDYHIAHQSQGLVPVEPAGFHGASIASRWPIKQVREVDLHLTPRTSDFPCKTMMADLDAPYGAVLFVNHLPSWQLDFERERELQAVAAARGIEELLAERPRHVIVVGDFDADPSSSSVRFWTGRQSLDGMSVCYRDAWESKNPGDPGHSYTPENHQMGGPDWPFRRIDYILVRSETHRGSSLDIVACRQVFTEPVKGIWASDHFGLVVDLENRSVHRTPGPAPAC